MSEWQPIEAAPDNLRAVVAGRWSPPHWDVFVLHRASEESPWVDETGRLGDDVGGVFFLAGLPPIPRAANLNGTLLAMHINIT